MQLRSMFRSIAGNVHNQVRFSSSSSQPSMVVVPALRREFTLMGFARGESNCIMPLNRQADLFLFNFRGIRLVEQGHWPQIINKSFFLDENRQIDLLRWPRFHPELLLQQHWSPAENMGRIKVIISEGYTYEMRAPGVVPTFVRTNNIASFSFQHAPQRMWHRLYGRQDDLADFFLAYRHTRECWHCLAKPVNVADEPVFGLQHISPEVYSQPTGLGRARTVATASGVVSYDKPIRIHATFCGLSGSKQHEQTKNHWLGRNPRSLCRARP
jgi:hypothetical protein